MPTTRSKSGGRKKEESWADRLSVREDSAPTRTAAFFGEQAVEGHQLLTERRAREANPQLSDPFFLNVQASARRMAERAAETPLPTSTPLTLNASATFYKNTWCPTGYKPSRGELDKRVEYLNMQRAAVIEAKKEEKATRKAYLKEMRAKQRASSPKREDGSPLW